MNQPISRPIGVTIVAILQILGGVLLLLAALSIFLAGNTILAEMAQQNPEISVTSAFLPILGTMLLVFAAIAFLIAFGLFRLKGWAWLATLILQGINVFTNLSSLISRPADAAGSLFQLIISGIIIYYFLTPGVKRAFGRSA